jgi:hypothetical protein
MRAERPDAIVDVRRGLQEVPPSRYQPRVLSQQIPSHSTLESQV